MLRYLWVPRISLKKDHYDRNRDAIREHQKEYNAKEDVRLNNQQRKDDNREHNSKMEKTYRDKKARTFYELFGEGLGMY